MRQNRAVELYVTEIQTLDRERQNRAVGLYLTEIQTLDRESEVEQSGRDLCDRHTDTGRRG